LRIEIGAPFVVVIGQEMPLRLAEMVPVIEGWLRLAEQEAMPIQFETHRNCITNDLFVTVQLLESDSRDAARGRFVSLRRRSGDALSADAELAVADHAHSRALRFVSRAGRGPRSNSAALGLSPERQMGRAVQELVARGLCGLAR
jgi:hypothetical protein